MNAKPIRSEMLEKWSRDYQASPERRLATLALSKTDARDAAYAIGPSYAMAQNFSINIETMEVTNQKHSGRCWLFAATNVMRERIAKELDLEFFELSQSYLAFWDKFERANYFLESIIDTADRPTDDRTVQFILTTGVHDGGQWEMCANIVRKYGLVPKDVYGETHQSSNTSSMNYMLNRSLKSCAVKLRAMIAGGAEAEEVQAAKAEMLDKIYGFLASCYTEPPKQFDFEYVDKDKNYHVERGLTPVQFAEKYVGDLLRKTVSIINAPTEDKPYGKTYTIRYLGNVAGGRPVVHLNLEMDDFKAAIIRQLEAGKVVWFGSDVGHFGERQKGIWDDKSYDMALLTGMDMEISKADGLNYWFSAMDHAMVITGVNLVDGKPTRWKIENSWGDENGKKGYYVCSDSWFNAYVYQAAVEEEYLGKQAELAKQEPVELDPWDPMGTLAD